MDWTKKLYWKQIEVKGLKQKQKQRKKQKTLKDWIAKALKLEDVICKSAKT